MIREFISFSFIKDYPTLNAGLQDIFGLSSSKIKKLYTKPSKLNIQVRKRLTVEIPIDISNHKLVYPVYNGEPVEVLSEDESFLVLNKPAGVHQHPLSYADDNNLVSYISENHPGLDQVNPENYDRGFVYRLDLGTSGIVYYAKSTAVYQKMRDNFHDLVESKAYIAVVEGKFPHNKTLFHEYHQSKGAARVVVNATEGDANSVMIKVQLLQYCHKSDLSLLRVELSEGKRHQIRAQLAEAGFPILGDELYGGKSAERIFLHCQCYQFNFEGKVYGQKTDLPELFNNLFDPDGGP